MKFSSSEVKQITKAWAVITLAFAIVFTGWRNIVSVQFLIALATSAVTVGLGFILHELAHKYFAQQYGAWAEFRSFDQFLGISLLFSFFGFVFVLPGAVFIRGVISTKRYGIISLAGPTTNFILGTIFVGIALLLTGFLRDASLLGAQINFWLAVFNLIPVWQMDGAKVFAWNRAIWAASFGLGLVALFGHGYLF